MANYNQPAFYSSGTDSRLDILRLRRRFLKDQEKIHLIYAKKGIAEQKRKKVCIFLKNLIGLKYLCYICVLRKQASCQILVLILVYKPKSESSSIGLEVICEGKSPLAIGNERAFMTHW